MTVCHTHQERGRVEAWQYTGQDFEKWPDWVRALYEGRPGVQPKHARIGNWALRDEDGYFWRWICDDLFTARYEPIASEMRPDPVHSREKI